MVPGGGGRVTSKRTTVPYLRSPICHLRKGGQRSKPRECEGERERAFPGGRGQVKGGIPPPALNLTPTTSSPLVGFSSLGLESAYLDMLIMATLAWKVLGDRFLRKNKYPQTAIKM